MSVQFGRWNSDGKPIDRGYLEKVRPLLARYGPDDLGFYARESISITYCAFHTTKESRHEKQPCLTASEAVITWDGRLDNREDLIRQLGEVVGLEQTDVSIVAAAYARWGNDCLGSLIGDWALSIWEPRTRSLILAKDPIGVRNLYYSLEPDQVIWSTILDPLVLLAGREFALCEEYIAGWFSGFPAAHLTPYVGIHSVPPSCSVLIKHGESTVRKYWDFDPEKRIRYRSDGEYEDHFRAVFSEAVRRRLRSDSPVLAELSGGMDSSSIVCVADTIIAREVSVTPRLDTISYYDDSEPNWNERPYFTKIEEKRRRTGCHIDFSNEERFNFDIDCGHFAPIPGCEAKRNEQVERFMACLAAQRNRVVLSGIGGDEVMGGVPTPIPELQDYLARAQFGTLARSLKGWALNNRAPWLYLLLMSIRCFLPHNPFGFQRKDGPAARLDSQFVKRNRIALQGPRTRVKLFGALPSFQGNTSTLIGLQKQLACEPLQADPPYEKRYPYLDRDLLEFMYAIPREQLVRPGRRRSLMRRSLRDLVPAEILERKRKAYVCRSPIIALQMVRSQIETLFGNALMVRYGLMDSMRLTSLVEPILSGKETKEWSFLMKSVLFELWLRTQAGYVAPADVSEHCHSSITSIGRIKETWSRLDRRSWFLPR